jgi:hypothetical protein
MKVLISIQRWLKLAVLCICPAIIYKLWQNFKWYDFNKIINLERKSLVKVPLLKRLIAWRRGFLSDRMVIYDLDKFASHRYLPDIPYWRAHPYNGMYSNLIDSKLNLHFTLFRFRQHLPVYYYLLARKEIIPLNDSAAVTSQDNTGILLALCQKKGKLAIKPVVGTRGEGFFGIFFDDKRFFLNGQPIEENELNRKLRTLDNYIVTEYIQQHPYADAFFPLTTNPVRILTLRDYNDHIAFVARAVQRIGTSRTLPVPLWTRGSLLCNVDVDSGLIGPGAAYPRNSNIIWHERHPDTDAPISGEVVPHWKNITTRIVEMADSLAMVPYMGWDIVVTENGFKVMEINSLSDIDMFQIHKPLLEDERIRQFYAMHISSLRNSR